MATSESKKFTTGKKATVHRTPNVNRSRIHSRDTEIKVTKFGKKGYIINKKSSSRLLKQYGKVQRYEQPLINIKIRNVVFPLSLRKDGRIYIPKSSAKKLKLTKPRKLKARPERIRRNQAITRKRVRLDIQGTENSIKDVAIRQQLDSENPNVAFSIADKLKRLIWRDVLYFSRYKTNFYMRLYFIIVVKRNGVFVYQPYTPTYPSDLLPKSASDRQRVKQSLDYFIEEQFAFVQRLFENYYEISSIYIDHYKVTAFALMKQRHKI